jgi:hypothetical protein
MRILIATDAWHPQVNGVVRVNLVGLQRFNAGRRSRLSDPGWSVPGVPTYPGCGGAAEPARDCPQDCAASPDAISSHRGADRWAVRAYCRRRKWLSRRPIRRVGIHRGALIIPAGVSYAVLRHFHAAAAMHDDRHRIAEAGTGARGSKSSAPDARRRHRPLTPDDPAELDLPDRFS